jgi:hypothetical protein
MKCRSAWRKGALTRKARMFVEPEGTTGALALYGQGEIEPSSSVSIPSMETSMAEIVLMNAWRDRNGRKLPKPAPARSESQGISSDLALAGQVVMFTGIRYERFDDRMDRKAENHRVELV